MGDIKYFGLFYTKELGRDIHGQRNLKEQKVKEIVENYNKHLFGVIQVSEREDGYYHIFDGQNRLRAASIIGLEKVPVVIHSGLTKQEESRLFWMYEETRNNISAKDMFISKVNSEEELQSEINNIVTKNGFQISNNNHRRSNFKNISAVKTLEKITNKYGCEVLNDTLAFVKRTWPSNSYSIHTQFIEGLAKLIYKGNLDKNFDTKHAFNRFIEINPQMFTSRAKSLGGNTVENIFRDLAEKYNSRLTAYRVKFY